jgi:hypothetical protein
MSDGSLVPVTDGAKLTVDASRYCVYIQPRQVFEPLAD